MPFVEHSYTYHVTRIDHRHNFSVYNTVLHLSSLQGNETGLRIESLAFLPQLLLSVVAIPLVMAKSDLATTMLAQTLAFVTFNKVCTSQVCMVSPLVLTLILTSLAVFPLVHGVPAILPSQLNVVEEA
jgi:phosphatidylinositol glycan class M